MVKKEKQTQNSKNKYLRKDSSFNIRDLVMRTPTSTSASRSPEVYTEEKQIKIVKQNLPSKPSRAELLKAGYDKLEKVIQELQSFDVCSIQRRSDPRVKVLTGHINDALAEVFGRDTEEYDNQEIYSLDTLPMTIGGSWYPLPEVREGYQKGIRSAISKLTALLDIQSKKLQTVASEKTGCSAPKETNHNPIIFGNEKVSLVNLRGKIRSRETVLFSAPQPADGNGQTFGKTNSDLIFSENAAKKEYLSHGIDKEAAGRSNDNEEVVKEVPFSALMEKLNEIVTTDPEYAEVFTTTDAGNKEGLAVAQEDGDRKSNTDVVSDGWCNETFIDISEPELSGLESEGEIIVIDGDNLLSSELDFIESLDNDSGPEKTIHEAHLEQNVSFTQEGMKRVSLEALEEKLRELEGKEAISGILTDEDQAGDEEIILIEGADDLPEEMMNELSRHSDQKVTCEERLADEEILIIDGDEELTMEPASLGSIKEVSFEEELVSSQGEVLVIDCDNGLPEDVSDELPGNEVLCDGTETDVHGGLLGEASPQSHESLPAQALQDCNLIIDLFSQATLLDIPLHNKDGDIRKTVLLEDLELRIQDFERSASAEDFSYIVMYYDIEKEEQTAEKDTNANAIHNDHTGVSDYAHKEPEGTSKVAFFGYDFLTNTTINKRIIEPLVYVTLDHAFADFRLMENDNISTIEDSAVETTPSDTTKAYNSNDIIDGSLLELSELLVYGDESDHALQERPSLFSGDEILFYDIKLDLVESAFLPEPEEKTSGDENFLVQTAEELSEQILPKEMVLLSDEQHVAILCSPVDLDASFVPAMLESRDERSLELTDGEIASLDAVVVPDTNDIGQAELTDFEEFIFRGALHVAGGEESMSESTREVVENEELTDNGFFDFEICSEQQNLFDEGLIAIDAEEEFKIEANITKLEEAIVIDSDSMQATVIQCLESDQEIESQIEPAECEQEFILSYAKDDSVIEPVHVESSITIPVMHDIEMVAQEEENIEASLLDDSDSISIGDHDTLPNSENLETFEDYNPSEHLEGNFSEHEPLSVEAFEKCLDEPQHSVLTDGSIESESRDNVLLEALEEMLSNLETKAPEQSHDQPIQTTAQGNTPQETEKVHVIESSKEPQKKAVLIKTKDERNNPFAMAELGREKAHAKPLRADDLLAQIGDLRYRIDDLKTFDIDSIEQRFDPKVRALGDSVNNTLSEIFGRNTPAYWQHALPSLDSLPVVVGGPKLSLEELRDAYRRRINDAISKVKITIDVLEAKLGSLQDKGHVKNQPIQTTAQGNTPQETEKVHVIESSKEPQKKAVLIKTKDERNNPFAMAELGREKAHAKPLRADDLLAQIGDLRYRIDDLKTFDIDSIEQRFDPKVRALGDSVNNTLSEIFGRNTPAYWQHALPSLDSLPVVVGGPKLSLEELRDAYRRRINDAISKVKITIDVLEAKLGSLQDKGACGQVLFFAPKEPKYPDIQSIR